MAMGWCFEAGNFWMVTRCCSGERGLRRTSASSQADRSGCLSTAGASHDHREQERAERSSHAAHQRPQVIDFGLYRRDALDGEVAFAFELGDPFRALVHGAFEANEVVVR